MCVYLNHAHTSTPSNPQTHANMLVLYTSEYLDFNLLFILIVFRQKLGIGIGIGHLIEIDKYLGGSLVGWVK